MSAKHHIKTAIISGILVGIFISLIDIIAKTLSKSLQWYEVYQSLLLTIIIISFVFIIYFLIIEALKLFSIFKIKKDSLIPLYFLISIATILILYLEIAINRYVLANQSLFSPLRLSASLGIMALIAITCLFFWKKERTHQKISSLINPSLRKTFREIIHLIAIFIFISLILDLYLISYIPKVQNNPEISEFPNIILITLDTQRADHLSLYGYPKTTSPNLDELSKESVIFKKAISSSSWTIPGHASILTGKYPSNHNAHRTHDYLDSKQVTLAELLKKKKYNTAGFIAGIFMKARYGMAQGFDIYKDRLDFFDHMYTYDKFSLPKNINFYIPIFKFLGSDKERTAKEVNQDVFKWLEKNKDTRFFIFINYFDVHDPYNLGKEFRSEFTDKSFDYSKVEKAIKSTKNKLRYGAISEEIVEYIKALYDAEIRYLDYHLGELFQKLAELGIKDNTLLIITADHGEEFYDHGGFLHMDTLYEEVIHIPLIIYFPKEFPAKQVSQRIETMNLFPTILDILEINAPKDIDGISLLPLLQNKTGYSRNYTFSELIPREEYNISRFEAISKNNWKLIEVTPHKSETPSGLFNLEEDPKEKKNKYQIETEIKNKLKAELEKIPVQR